MCECVCVNEDVCAGERRLLGERVEGLAICRTIEDWALYCAGSGFYAVSGGGGLLDAGVMGIRRMVLVCHALKLRGHEVGWDEWWQVVVSGGICG